ncbi:hypothetical protein [Clostridium polynesiense]|uniref:hypothetical protein n=1 Tax=Clostridium polynesiense TaxID=1325933 RepID=UPI000590D6A8|nr:hypothetical protein [Clostridium polynesiense]
MKKVITMLMMSVIILTTVLLGGCGKSDPAISKKETPYTVVENLSADGQKDIKNYLTEKSPDVIKIKETTEGYIKAHATVDYKTTDGMGTYGYVNDEILKELKEKNDAEETIKGFKQYKVVQELNGLKIDSITITKGMNLAEIKGTFTFKYLEGTDDFFKKYNKEKNTLYQQNFRVQMEKKTDVWKVSFSHIKEEDSPKK